MAQVLKVFQLAQHDRVAQMNIRRGGIDAELHAQRLAGRDGFFELRLQLILANDFGDALREIGKLLLNGLKLGGGRQSVFLRSSRLHLGLFDQDAAAVEAIAPFQHNAHRFGINAMLLAQDALGKRVFRVGIVNRDHRLQNDRPGVQILVHEMHGAAGEFRAVLERLPLRFKSRKRRQQRRMNIQDAVGKRRDEIGRKQPHVACEADQIDIFFPERRDYQFVVGLALQSLWMESRAFRCRDARALIDSLRVLAIAHHEGDLRVGDASGGDAIGQSFEIGSAS